MALSFPHPPTAGQQYVGDGVTYEYDGTLGAWVKLKPVQSALLGAAAQTGAAIIPGGTDAERAAITAPTAGMFRYNDQTSPAVMEYYDGTAWVDLATAGGGGGGALGPWSFVEVAPGFTSVLVAYGNGRFVTAGYFSTAGSQIPGALQTSFSTDGYTWSTPATLDAAITNWGTNNTNLIFANGKFVLLSSTTKKSYTSTDGATWLTGAATANFYNLLAGGGGSFVASGNISSGTGTLYSTDGLNWTPVTIPGGTGSLGAAYRTGNEYLLLVPNGSDASLLKSTDGGASWSVSLASLGISGGTFGIVSDGVDYYIRNTQFGLYKTTTGTSVTALTQNPIIYLTSQSPLIYYGSQGLDNTLMTGDGFASGALFDTPMTNGAARFATNGSVMLGTYSLGMAVAKFV